MTSQIYSGDKFNRKMTEVLKNESSLAKPFSADMLEVDGETAGVDAWRMSNAMKVQLMFQYDHLCLFSVYRSL